MSNARKFIRNNYKYEHDRFKRIIATKRTIIRYLKKTFIQERLMIVEKSKMSEDSFRLLSTERNNYFI